MPTSLEVRPVLSSTNGDEMGGGNGLNGHHAKTKIIGWSSVVKGEAEGCGAPNMCMCV